MSLSIADGGLWNDHYPKASWMLGAAMAAGTGNLETTKWLQLYLAIVAAIVLWRGLIATEIRSAAALILAASAAFSPVTIGQLGTGYVDGLLGSALAIQVGAWLSWDRHRDNNSYSILLCGALLAINLKFTGLVFSALLLLIFLPWSFFHGLPATRVEKTATAIAVCVAAISSAQTYIHNINSHGHPFYPINEVNILKGQAPEQFLSKNRFVKFMLSNSVGPTATLGLEGLAYWIPPVPRPSNYSELSADSRKAGFGSLFIWSLLIALPTIAFCAAAPSAQARQSASATSLFAVMGWIGVSAFAISEFWWARYVPQLWLLPIFASVLALASGRAWLGIVIAACAAAGSSIALAYWAHHLVVEQAHLRQQKAIFTDQGQVAVLKSWNSGHGIFVFARQLEQSGVKVLPTEDAVKCKRNFGIVRYCETKVRP